MTKTWKDVSTEYRQKLLNRYSLKESIETFDIETFKRNPKKFFDENGWIIPQENFEEIVETLSELANSDSEFGPEGMDLGRRGEYVQDVVQKLMKTDKNFYNNIMKVSKEVEGKMIEGKGKGRKILMTSLLCLSILAGVVSCDMMGPQINGGNETTISANYWKEVNSSRGKYITNQSEFGEFSNSIAYWNLCSGELLLTKEGTLEIYVYGNGVFADGGSGSWSLSIYDSSNPDNNIYSCNCNLSGKFVVSDRNDVNNIINILKSKSSIRIGLFGGNYVFSKSRGGYTKTSIHLDFNTAGLTKALDYIK